MAGAFSFFDHRLSFERSNIASETSSSALFQTQDATPPEALATLGVQSILPIGSRAFISVAGNSNVLESAPGYGLNYALPSQVRPLTQSMFCVYEYVNV